MNKPNKIFVMKRLIIISMLTVFCGSFVKAQTSTVDKKATLMPEGAVVTDLKTGEVIRTVKSGVSISDIERNTINLIDPQNSGPGKNAEPAGLPDTNNSSNPGSAKEANPPVNKNKAPKKD